MSRSSKDITPRWVHFIGGGTGGCMGALITCPLEVIKTQNQALYNRKLISMGLKAGQTPGLISTLSAIVSLEGIRGLWKGLGPNLVGVFPSRAIYFGTYNATKSNLLSSGYPESSFVHLISAMAAGIAVSTATSPLWLVKTRMQLQTPDSPSITGQPNYKSSFDCVRRVYQEEGIRGFYKGLGASYLGIAESSIQFVLYEKMKSARLAKTNNTTLSNYEYMAIAASAKLVAAISTYPHEVLRTRMREQRGSTANIPQKYTGLFQALQLIFKEEGFRGMYGGMSTHLLRVVPNAAIMFWTYELVVRQLS